MDLNEFGVPYLCMYFHLTKPSIGNKNRVNIIVKLNGKDAPMNPN